MQIWMCCIVYTILSVYALVTPITLTAMTLERYVAICMPLRHAELCSMRGAVKLILIIHSISSVPCTVNLSIFSATVSSDLYTNSKLCYREMFVLFPWQGHLSSAMDQFYFLIMLSVIVFSYVQIMKAAKAASGENKKSTWKDV
ncbi:hypothetical protein OJAV_G00131810 [Oryzias javanicus]|uniref:G-protein coupled receptors family 1 profile domain-containing protein n=1 Tax=Oryzias javanicus TaxID=123683 RepID=A0A437CQU1_ORYJA|nr:hypothetical protein OJAV_G00131810 [Oryzias javanicus]